MIRAGELAIDEDTYAARLRGRPLDLTYKEFELLKFLAQHPGRVFTRAQLLQEVWGYDYFGGTRTVDVHVRRLRAKLGPEHEALIGTVRNVGYRFVPAAGDRQAARRATPVAQPGRSSVRIMTRSGPSRTGARRRRRPRCSRWPTAATAADGVAPLSEHVMLHLRYGGETPAGISCVTARRRPLAGYAPRRIDDARAAPSSSCTRRTGGRASAGRCSLARRSRPAAGCGSGRTATSRPRARSPAPPASPRVRALWQMRRSLTRAAARRRRCRPA